MTDKKKKVKKQRETSEASVIQDSILNPLEHNQNFWRKNWGLASLLMIFSIAIYYQCTHFGYVLDDQIVITDNSFTKKGFGGIVDLMTTESMTGYFGEQKNLVEGNRYRPLSLVTFAAEYDLSGGLNPRLSHWINILLYGLTGILLFRWLSMLFLHHEKTKVFSTLLAFGVSLLFVVHPIHVEAVANIKGRDEIMALLFSILTVYYGFKYEKDRVKWKLVVANVMFFLGLLSKENTITFLAIIPLTLYFFSTKNLWNAMKSVWSYLITTILYLVLRFSVSGVPKLGAGGNDLMNNPFLDMNLGEKYATILYTLGLYIKLLFVPFPLTHDYYPYAIPKMNFGDWHVWLSFALYLGLVVFAFKKLKSKNIAGYAIWFYLITLTIVSNVVINLGTFMNDRFVYMSSIGFCILLIWGLNELRLKIVNNGKSVALGFFALLILGYSFISFTRVPDWESSMTLNQSAIKVSSNSARANTFMATALFQEGLKSGSQEKMSIMKEAFPYAAKSIEIYPTYYNGNLMYAGIASEIYKMDNDIDQFIQHFEKVMKVRPDIGYLTEFSKYLNERGTAPNKLNEMYKRVGESLITRNKKFDAKWAAHYLNMAYAINPNDRKTNLLMGQAYQLLGDQSNANRFFNAANR